MHHLLSSFSASLPSSTSLLTLLAHPPALSSAGGWEVGVLVSSTLYLSSSSCLRLKVSPMGHSSCQKYSLMYVLLSPWLQPLPGNCSTMDCPRVAAFLGAPLSHKSDKKSPLQPPSYQNLATQKQYTSKAEVYSAKKHVLLLCPLFIYNEHVLLIRIHTSSVAIIETKF